MIEVRVLSVANYEVRAECIVCDKLITRPNSFCLLLTTWGSITTKNGYLIHRYCCSPNCANFYIAANLKAAVKK